VLLYNSQVSGNCYKVRLLLAHLGLDYERQEVDVVDRSNRPDLLGGLNPALRVPTLVLDDGRALGESGAILWYFGEGTRFLEGNKAWNAYVKYFEEQGADMDGWTQRLLDRYFTEAYVREAQRIKRETGPQQR